MTNAVLGLEVRSDSVKEGAVDLDKLAVSAKNAEVAAQQLAGGARSAGASVTQLNAATNAEAVSQAKATATARMHTVALDAQALAARHAGMMGRQLSFQLIDIGQSIPLAFQSPLFFLQNVGFQLAQIGQLFMGQGGLKAGLTESIAMVGRFAIRFAPVLAIIGAVSAAIAGMRSEIEKTTGVAVTFGDVALAVWQTVRDGIYNLLRPAIEAVSPWFAQAWEMVAAATKAVGNYIIRSFETTFATIKVGILSIPDAFIAAGQAAAQGFVNAMVEMARSVTVILNGLINDINNLAIKAGISKQGAGGILPLLDLPNAPTIDIGGDAATSRLQGRLSDLQKTLEDIRKSDPLGDFYTSVQDHALQNARDRLKEVGGAAKGASHEIHRAANDNVAAWQRLNENIQAAKGVVNGFLTDIRQGLKNGEGFWQTFANAATNAVDRIADRIQTNLVDALFAPTAAGGGGIISWLTGLLGSGAPAPVAAGLFHQGGVVGSATPMRFVHPAYFDNAPRLHRGGMIGPDERPAILKLGERVIPAGATSTQPTKFEAHINIDLTGANGDKAIAAASRAAANEGARLALAQWQERQKAYG